MLLTQVKNQGTKDPFKTKPRLVSNASNHSLHDRKWNLQMYRLSFEANEVRVSYKDLSDDTVNC